MRTLQSGHTVIRADQFDPDGWQLPEITELCQNNDEGQETTPNGDGPTRSHLTNLPTTSPRFKSGKQMHGAFQTHEQDVRTSSRLRPPTDCYPEERHPCDVLQTMRDAWGGSALTRPWWNGILGNRTLLASTGKRPVEIERSFFVHTETGAR